MYTKGDNTHGKSNFPSSVLLAICGNTAVSAALQ